MSHRHFTGPATVAVTRKRTPSGTALAVINTTYRWDGAYSEDRDFGRRDRKNSRVGAAATSAVRSFQSLMFLGKGGISCSQHSRRAQGTRETSEWDWRALLTLSLGQKTGLCLVSVAMKPWRNLQKFTLSCFPASVWRRGPAWCRQHATGTCGTSVPCPSRCRLSLYSH